MRLFALLLVAAVIAGTGAAQAQSARAQRTLCFGAQGEPAVLIAACTETITSGVAGTDADLAFAYAIRGGAQRAAGNLDSAMSDYSRAIELAPRYAPFRINRAAIYTWRNDYAAALEDFDMAIRYSREYAQAYVGRGGVRLQTGNEDGALQDFDRALDINPQYGRAHYGRGQIFSLRHDYERALVEYDEAVRLSPEDAEFRNNACFLRAQLRRDLDRALSDCEAAVFQSSGNRVAYDSRAFVKYQRGDLEGALADYNSALGQGAVAHSLYGRGVVRLALGQAAEGRADIEAAIALDAGIAAEYAAYGVAP